MIFFLRRDISRVCVTGKGESLKESAIRDPKPTNDDRELLSKAGEKSLGKYTLADVKTCEGEEKNTRKVERKANEKIEKPAKKKNAQRKGVAKEGPRFTKGNNRNFIGKFSK